MEINIPKNNIPISGNDNNIINAVDKTSLDNLSDKEKEKATMILFNEKDYKISTQTINNKIVFYITEIKTGDEYELVDYVKNKI